MGMFSSVRMHRGASGLASCFVVTAIVAGCGKSDEITSYSIPKERAPAVVATANDSSSASTAASPAGAETSVASDPATGPDRMLGAVVMRPDQAWFFKLTGPEAAVAEVEQAYLDFLKTVEFTGPNGAPVWKAPEGWVDGPPKAMRFATLMIPSGDAKLELAISSLPTQGGDVDAYLLMNLNRWRGQLGLAPSTLDAMRGAEGELETIDLPGGNQALVTNMRGKLTGGGMMAPFAR